MRTTYGFGYFIDKYMPVFIVGAIFVVCSFCVYMAVRQAREREQFIIDHDCKVVERRSGQAVTTIGPDGKVSIGSTSSQTSYLCDDGVVYTW